TGDATIRSLNREYRAKDKTTDVLSFPQLPEDGSTEPSISVAHSLATDVPLLLGDIVLSIDTAAGQAQAMAQPLSTRLRTLLIHGLLHLLGYDHERSPSEARRMFARERELAAALDDIGSPASRSPAHISKRHGRIQLNGYPD